MRCGLKTDILTVYEDLKFDDLNEGKIGFLGKGNIWIKNTYESDTDDLIRYIMNEAICKTAPGQLSFVGYDANYSGVFAPFAELSSGANRQLELLGSFKELEDYLILIGQQINAVQNVIQGRSKSLTEFRLSINRPIERYKLVVLSMNFSELEASFLSILSSVMQHAPAAGISFLIIPANNKISGERKPQALDRNISILMAKGHAANHLSHVDTLLGTYSYNHVENAKIIENCQNLIEQLKSTELPVVLFSEVNDISYIWDRTSESGLSFSVGKYGVNNVEITIGDEINQRHNILITGAVGQGKSNLISAIIHSLCLRYSPNELELYLLDFKEGVSLKPFCGFDEREYLPHAKVVGLESVTELGLAVLEHLYNEYLKRLRLFKDKNVKSIQEYRKTYPEEIMPRIVAIIDEFQLMFGDEAKMGQRIIDLLEKSVRLFRAAGIHFILATQAISSNPILSSKASSLFSQVPIRIAHKNSISESQNTLGYNNAAAAYLRAREAIVNLDYGEISQNKKTVIAWADEKVLLPMRMDWWMKWRDISERPYVYESGQRISAGMAIVSAEKLKMLTYPTALIGERIAIFDRDLRIPFPNEAGRNIAIIGSTETECSLGDGIIQGIALSLAAIHADKSQFLFCDFRGKDESIEEKYPRFIEMLKEIGASVDNIRREAFLDTVMRITNEVTTSPESKTFIFGIGMDRLECETGKIEAPLKKFVTVAPEKGVHFIGWWIKLSSFSSQVAGFGRTDAFNSKIFLRIDLNSLTRITNSLIPWAGSDNRALLCNEIDFSEEITFIPYAPII